MAWLYVLRQLSKIFGARVALLKMLLLLYEIAAALFPQKLQSTLAISINIKDNLIYQKLPFAEQLIKQPSAKGKFVLLKELLDRIQNAGLSAEQASRALEIVITWTSEQYPVAGTIISTWVKNNSDKRY